MKLSAKDSMAIENEGERAYRRCYAEKLKPTPAFHALTAQAQKLIDALPQGRIAEVIGVAEPCAVRRDGGVVCRSSGSTEMRSLELREPDPPPGPDQK